MRWSESMFLKMKSKQSKMGQVLSLSVLSFTLCACVSIDTGQGVKKTQNQAPPQQVEKTSAQKKVSLEEAASFNMTLGAQYLKQNNLGQAIVKLEKAVEQQPTLALAHTYLAFAYERYGETEKASTHYSRAVKLDPNDPISLNNYGTFLCRQNDALESLKYFERAAGNRRYQTPDAAMTNAGVCAKKIPDYIRADKYFHDAIRMNPRNTQAYYHLTDVNLELENLVIANGFFKTYKSLTTNGTENPEYLYLAYRLNKAMNNPDQAGQYALQLQQNFPSSDQTKELLERR